MADEVPSTFTVYPNYPNPFNPSTDLRYDLSVGSFVRAAVYDISGRLIKKLVSSQQTAGQKIITWSGTNDKGGAVSGGIYFCVIEAGNARQVIKMMLVK